MFSIEKHSSKRKSRKVYKKKIIGFFFFFFCNPLHKLHLRSLFRYTIILHYIRLHSFITCKQYKILVIIIPDCYTRTLTVRYKSWLWLWEATIAIRSFARRVLILFLLDVFSFFPTIFPSTDPRIEARGRFRSNDNLPRACNN